MKAFFHGFQSFQDILFLVCLVMLLLSAAAILVNQEPRLLSELKVLKTKSKAIRTNEPKKIPLFNKRRAPNKHRDN